MQSVTANPRTGPVPNWKRMSPVISVVILASTMADTALLKPSSTAVRGARRRSSSSRMRSKMSTFASTAIPIERISPRDAGQGQRRVERRKPAMTSMR